MPALAIRATMHEARDRSASCIERALDIGGRVRLSMCGRQVRCRIAGPRQQSIKPTVYIETTIGAISPHDQAGMSFDFPTKS
jgi:hypothetical protein